MINSPPVHFTPVHQPGGSLYKLYTAAQYIHTHRLLYPGYSDPQLAVVRLRNNDMMTALTMAQQQQQPQSSP